MDDTTNSAQLNATEPIQHELVDDDGDKENPNAIKFGDVTVNLDSIRRCMPPRAFMTGSLATFYFKHYIPNVMLRDITRRDRIIFYDSDCYTLIRRKCEKYIREGTDGDITTEKKKNVLLPFVTDLVQKEIIMMPLFWGSHWILGLLQKYPADGQNSYKGRLIIVDSKFNDLNHKEILTKIAENIFYHIFMAIRAALIVSSRRWSIEFSLIRCNSMPCQTNNSDCGWFMCAFAEHFAKNINWMGYSDEHVRQMALATEEEKKFYSRLTVMKKEIGTYMEKMAGRPLYFNYGD